MLPQLTVTAPTFFLYLGLQLFKWTCYFFCFVVRNCKHIWRATRCLKRGNLIFFISVYISDFIKTRKFSPFLQITLILQGFKLNVQCKFLLRHFHIKYFYNSRVVKQWNKGRKYLHKYKKYTLNKIKNNTVRCLIGYPRFGRDCCCHLQIYCRRTSAL